MSEQICLLINPNKHIQESKQIQSGRSNILRMSEVDYQAMQHMLTNCRVGVFVSLCRNGMASLIDAHLYLPKHGVSNTNHFNKAAVPEEYRYYQSKCEIVLSIETAKQRRVCFGYVGMGGDYGNDPGFLCGINNLDPNNDRFSKSISGSFHIGGDLDI